MTYLKNYRGYMDFARRIAAGEPIGSGVTEAGCKLIFNQRLKQSGMRWHRETGQHIVDLRTAVRGGLWSSIWNRLLPSSDALPPLTRATQNQNVTEAPKKAVTELTAPGQSEGVV